MVTRLFHPETLIENTEVTLNDFATKHVQDVLRIKMGDPLVLFNGLGGQYQGTISHIKKKQIRISIIAHEHIERESPLHTHLGQVISRGKKMDLTIQKAVELGVNEITPLISERCGVQLNNDRFEKKLSHWRRIVISACEQCGRNQLPTIHPPVALNNWLQQNKLEIKIVCDPRGNVSIRQLQNQLGSVPSSACLLVGSEGGFTSVEIEQALNENFVIIHLGSRILRTETAGVTLLSLIQQAWGDMV